MRFEIDMQPRCSAHSSHVDRLGHHARRDTPPLEPWINTGIQNKGMSAAVPRHIDEPDQPIIRISADMRKATREHMGEVHWHRAPPGPDPKEIDFFFRRKGINAQHHHVVINLYRLRGAVMRRNREDVGPMTPMFHMLTLPAFTNTPSTGI
jgi:hypothetical protein